LRTEDEDDAVGGAVHNLDIAVAGREFGFADDYGRIEMDRDVVGGGLSVDGTAKSKRSAAKCRKDFHGISW
jgi:hypothetical protein